MDPVCHPIADTAKEVKKANISQLKSIDRRNVEAVIRYGLQLSETFLLISAYDYRGNEAAQASVIFSDHLCRKDCNGAVVIDASGGPSIIPIRHNGTMVSEVYLNNKRESVKSNLTYVFLDIDKIRLVALDGIYEEKLKKNITKLTIAEEGNSGLFYGASFKQSFYKECLLGDAMSIHQQGGNSRRE